MLSQLTDERVQLRGWHDGGQQADAQRFRGVEYLGSEEVAARGARPNGAQHVRTDGGGREAELRFRETELRLRRADRDVAGRDEPRATGESGSMHARDGRFIQPVERRQHVSERARIAQVLFVAVARHALHPVEIRAGTERRAVAGQHDYTDIRIGVELGTGFRKRRDQRVVEGIAHLGPVERHPGDAVLALHADVHPMVGSTSTSVLTELATKHFSCAFSCSARCSSSLGALPE